MIASSLPGMADFQIQPEVTTACSAAGSLPGGVGRRHAAAVRRHWAADSHEGRRAAIQAVEMDDWRNVARRQLALFEDLIASRQAMAA